MFAICSLNEIFPRTATPKRNQFFVFRISFKIIKIYNVTMRTFSRNSYPFIIFSPLFTIRKCLDEMRNKVSRASKRYKIPDLKSPIRSFCHHGFGCRLNQSLTRIMPKFSPLPYKLLRWIWIWRHHLIGSYQDEIFSPVAYKIFLFPPKYNLLASPKPYNNSFWLDNRLNSALHSDWYVKIRWKVIYLHFKSHAAKKIKRKELNRIWRRNWMASE